MSIANSPPRVAVYIDGFNLYHAIDDLNKPHLKWLNLYDLSKKLLRNDETLAKVHFFTTIVDWQAGKQDRHETYVKALEAKGVVVSPGNFKRSHRHCSKNQTSCPFREEKQTDVAIGVNMVADAFLDIFDRVIMLTADTDQIPAVKMIKTHFPNKQITWLAPPGRMQETRELGNLIPDRAELTAGMIGNCRLPNRLKDAEGNVICTMPPAYGI
jgi:uncharacterized LabA/DUF88 family protein